MKQFYYPLINGILQVIFLFIYSYSLISKNLYINISIFILLLNLSAFILISIGFKRNLQFFISFIFLSFVSSALTLITAVFILSYFSLGAPINKLINQALAGESTINNTVRWSLSYFLFAIFPAYIVVLAGVRRKKKSIIHHVIKKKRRK